jgi:hypothetical protein
MLMRTASAVANPDDQPKRRGDEPYHHSPGNCGEHSTMPLDPGLPQSIKHAGTRPRVELAITVGTLEDASELFVVHC